MHNVMEHSHDLTFIITVHSNISISNLCLLFSDVPGCSNFR
jgi:hypothetical protein